MKRALLIGGGIAGVIVIAVVAAAVFFLSNLDSIVKAAVEKVGSDVTQTQVTLNDVEISPAGGRGTLRSFRMTNPAGFSDSDAFKFDEVSVAIDIATIQSDPVVIKEVLIDGPEVTYELGPDGSNIQTIQKNVAKAAPAQGDSSDSSSSADSKGPNLVIENLILRNGQVHVTATQLLDQKISSPLPQIHLKDIGKQDNGATPGEIAVQTLDAVLKQVTSAVAQMDISQIADRLNINAEDIQQTLQKGVGGISGVVGEGAGEAAGGVGEAVEGVAKEAEGALKNLLGGQNQD